ncbi:unnamed protein product, partial [Rotaria magnacalcarata]
TPQTSHVARPHHSFARLGSHISGRPDLGRCDGKDRRTGGYHHRYD